MADSEQSIKVIGLMLDLNCGLLEASRLSDENDERLRTGARPAWEPVVRWFVEGRSVCDIQWAEIPLRHCIFPPKVKSLGMPIEWNPDVQLAAPPWVKGLWLIAEDESKGSWFVETESKELA